MTKHVILMSVAVQKKTGHQFTIQARLDWLWGRVSGLCQPNCSSTRRTMVPVLAGEAGTLQPPDRTQAENRQEEGARVRHG